jgi:poly(3-hydroxybutyrate) depolymerase
MGGGSAAGSSGGGGMTPSMGCGTPAGEMSGAWVERPTLDVRGVARRWWVWLPAGYDPSRAYPVIFLLHGCGNETNNVPMQRVIDATAILVRSRAVSHCWDTSANGPDVELFSALVSATEAAYCVDSSRRFAVGYSSGSWLVNAIECADGTLLRAAASVAGGTPRAVGCSGRIARLFVHDANDPENSISGNVTERDRLIGVNGCDAAIPPVPEDPAPCARYQGCDEGYPVIWCETMGNGHDRQDALASQAAWGLFTEF